MINSQSIVTMKGIVLAGGRRNALTFEDQYSERRTYTTPSASKQID